jgi:hypothetical protein
MDLYTAEKLFLERSRDLEITAERHARLVRTAQSCETPRAWIARRLRALADRVDEEPRLLRA